MVVWFGSPWLSWCSTENLATEVSVSRTDYEPVGTTIFNLRPQSTWNDNGELESIALKAITTALTKYAGTGDKQYAEKARVLIKDLNRCSGEWRGSLDICPDSGAGLLSEDVSHQQHKENRIRRVYRRPTASLPTPSIRESIGGYYPDYYEPYKPKGIPFNVVKRLESQA